MKVGDVYIEPHGDESPGVLTATAYGKLQQLVNLYDVWPALVRTDFGDGSAKESASAEETTAIALSLESALADFPRHCCYRQGSENPLGYWSGPHGRKWLRKLARACHLGPVDLFTNADS